MARACVVCGGSPTTREHVWPDWLRRRVDIRQAVAHDRTLKREGQEIVHSSFPLPPFALAVRAVCAHCNNGWMAGLEDETQRLLDGPLSGRGRALHRDGQATLATWAVKTALMFEQANPRDARAVPDQHYRMLYRERRPPRGISVWMAAYTAGHPGVYHHSGLALTPRADMPEPDGCNVWSVTFTLGPVAFQLFGTTLEELFEMETTWPPGVHQLWPYGDSFTWTSAPAFDDAGLAQFAGAIYEGLMARTRKVVR